MPNQFITFLRSPLIGFGPFKSIPHTKLVDLNDDCLAYVFELLDIYDLYAVGCASERCKNVFPLFNRKFEYSVTNINASNLKHFLKTIGAHIRTLHVNINERNKNNFEILEFFDWVQQYCVNVRHLTVKKWQQLNFEKCQLMLNRLESLQLDECAYAETNELLNRRFLIKPWIVAQPAFYSLQTTSLKSSDLTHLTNIRTLKLHNCKGFRPAHLMEFLVQNNKLTELSLITLNEFKGDTFDDNFFNGFSKYLQEIDTISIDMNTTNHIQFIATLPKLTKLKLLDYSVYNDRIVDRLLRKLCDLDTITELDLYHCNLGRNTYRVISQFSKLHTLKMRKNFWINDQHLQTLNLMPALRTICCFDSIILSDDGVISFVKIAPNLTQLDCSWCFQVTNRAIFEIHHLLHHQKHRPKLEILAGGRTKITESVMNVSLPSHFFFDRFFI